jgi:histidinol-phosphate aminotransferase
VYGLSLEPRPEIRVFGAGVHGGPDHAELQALGLDPAGISDFSVCTNPFMPPPEVTGLRLENIPISQYPDSESSDLKNALAARHSRPPENVLVGSGTTELIRLIAHTYLRPGDNIVTFSPTYGEYELAARIAGANVIEQPLSAGNNFNPDTAETAELIERHSPRVVFICNPNNPTGRYLDRPEMEIILAAAGDGLLVMDEAYVSFVARSWPAVDLVDRGNVIILRSMTKDYGLAGLRLGYAIARPEIIADLKRVQPPWSVNAVAQRAGRLALADDSFLAITQEKIWQAKQLLATELTRLGWLPLPSDTHYCLVKAGNAGRLRTALLKSGILVRDCTSFGLPEYIRLGIRPEAEVRRLIAAIEEICRKGELYVSI